MELHMDESCRMPGSEKTAQITLFGVPFDRRAAGVPGQSFGPDAIRKSWQLLEPKGRFRDIGNLVCGSPEDVDSKLRETVSRAKNPFIALGGDHSITIPIVEALKPEKVVLFDAHDDFRDEYLGFKRGAMNVAARIADVVGRENVCVIGARQISEGRSIIRTEIPDGFQKCYVSIDIDVLDPSVAPGTGTPVPDGLGVKELLNLLVGLEPVAADIVEVNPLLESNITPATAAYICQHLLKMPWSTR